MKKQVRIVVTGRVQGVCFRYYTQQRAVQLGLNGFVRNLDGGEVEIVAEGEQETLERLIGWARIGPPRADVTDIEVSDAEPTQLLSGFTIRQ